MKWLSRPFIGLLFAFLLMGNADPYKERRAENDRIQAVIRQTIQYNKQPDPEGAPRITRILRNSYRNTHPPYFPKTIYREPIRPPFPTGHKRFYGGIPR